MKESEGDYRGVREAARTSYGCCDDEDKEKICIVDNLSQEKRWSWRTLLTALRLRDKPTGRSGAWRLWISWLLRLNRLPCWSPDHGGSQRGDRQHESKRWNIILNYYYPSSPFPYCHRLPLRGRSLLPSRWVPLRLLLRRQFELCCSHTQQILSRSRLGRATPQWGHDRISRCRLCFCCWCTRRHYHSGRVFFFSSLRRFSAAVSSSLSVRIIVQELLSL